MEAGKADILKRLRRIEGQVKGIQRMIDKDEQCNDVLVQIAAVRAAINKVGGLILENYSKSCILKLAENSDGSENLDDLIETIIKFTK